MGKWKLGYLAVVLAVAVPAGLMAAPRRTVSHETKNQTLKNPYYTQVSELLTQIKEHAWAIRTSVGALDLRARSADADWEMEDNALNDVRNNVNAMGRDLARLENLRVLAQPWERQEIDRIAPLARQLATDTNNAIRVFNANRTHEWSTEVPNDFAVIRQKAGEIHKSVSESTEMAELRKEIKGLEEGM